MWSGNISGQGDTYPTQWALNPNAQYLHMPQEQVDWASLAQQWIKMKEEAPQMEKEQGEAPMEITKDDTIIPTPAPTAVPNPPAWPATQIQSGPDAASWWGWGQAGTTGSWTMAAPYTTIPAATDTTVAQTTSSFPYTPAAPPTPEAFVPPPATAYWGNEVRIPAVKEETPSWENKNHKKPVVDTVTEIDAAKRKQLPAWIREGLEKMEREKQRKAENERLERERKEALLKKSHVEAETISTSQIDGNGYEEPQKSKFESDSSDEETDEKEKFIEEVKPRKSRFDVRQVSPPKPVFRTKEQILQAVMGDVRKILTQILMEVTTEEIEKAVEDVSRYFRKKAPATTVRKTQALTSLTGKLGLGIYESDSESGDSSDEKVTNDPDSDQEIKERIERLKNDFVQTERHIEREVIEQEEREKKQLLKEKRDSSEEREGQVQTQLPLGASKEKQIEYKSQQFEDHHRHRDISNASHGESVSKVTTSPRDKHTVMTKEVSSSSSSNTGGSSSRSSVTRKSERSRKRSSSSSSSTSSSSSSDRRRRRSRSRDRRDRRPQKRRRHHSHHRRRSSSSSPSPPRRHHHRHRR